MPVRGIEGNPPLDTDTQPVQFVTHRNEDGTVCNRIASTASVSPECYVGPGVQVLQSAILNAGAFIADSAVVQGRAVVSGTVYGRAQVGGNTFIPSGYAVMGTVVLDTIPEAQITMDSETKASITDIKREARRAVNTASTREEALQENKDLQTKRES